ncbi:MAG: PilN domain-containing protein [Phycisphaerales bacterium]|nr:PilN domain-containing protein [Phycisphaerales bacterium]
MDKSGTTGSKGGSFLPAEYVKGKGQVRASLMAMLLFVLVLAGVIGAFFVNHQRWRQVHSEQKVVQAAFAEEAGKIEQLKKLEKQRDDLLERAEIVTALKDRVPRSVLIGEIVRGIPQGMILTKLDLNGERVKPPEPKKDPKKKKGAKKGSLTNHGVGQGKDADAKPKKVHAPKFKYALTIDGIATNNDEVADFLGAMKSSKLFKEVELKYIDTTMIDKVDYRRFSITMKIASNADANMLADTEQVDIHTGGFGIAGEESTTD